MQGWDSAVCAGLLPPPAPCAKPQPRPRVTSPGPLLLRSFCKAQSLLRRTAECGRPHGLPQRRTGAVSKRRTVPIPMKFGSTAACAPGAGQDHLSGPGLNVPRGSRDLNGQGSARTASAGLGRASRCEPSPTPREPQPATPPHFSKHTPKRF